jgi:hypothetical protein
MNDFEEIAALRALVKEARRQAMAQAEKIEELEKVNAALLYRLEFQRAENEQELERARRQSHEPRPLYIKE